MGSLLFRHHQENLWLSKVVHIFMNKNVFCQRLYTFSWEKTVFLLLFYVSVFKISRWSTETKLGGKGWVGEGECDTMASSWHCKYSPIQIIVRVLSSPFYNWCGDIYFCLLVFLQITFLAHQLCLIILWLSISFWFDWSGCQNSLQCHKTCSKKRCMHLQTTCHWLDLWAQNTA